MGAYDVGNVNMHGLCLLVVVYYFLGGIAVGLGLHRMLAHRAFVLPKWLEYCIITLSLPAGTPIQWVGTHRCHHLHTERAVDPHSPHISGFWHAHVGWYLGTANRLVCALYALAGPGRMLFDSVWRPRTNQEHNHLAKDISDDLYYRWVSRPAPYALLMWLHLACAFGMARHYGGWQGVSVLWCELILMYNLGDAVDSIGHLHGHKPYRQANESRNNPVLAWCTLGEGWHANHHAFPRSARHGLLGGQCDWTWQVIQALQQLRLARNVWLPRDEDVRAGRVAP